MEKLNKIKFREEITANNTFIGAQRKLDEIIDRLKEIRGNMRDCEGWAHAEGACHHANNLIETTNEMIYLIKGENK